MRNKWYNSNLAKFSGIGIAFFGIGLEVGYCVNYINKSLNPKIIYQIESHRKEQNNIQKYEIKKKRNIEEKIRERGIAKNLELECKKGKI